MAENMTPEEEGSDVREMVWEMSRMTNKILIIGILPILTIPAVLMYCGTITFPSLGVLSLANQVLCSSAPWNLLLDPILA